MTAVGAWPPSPPGRAPSARRTARGAAGPDHGSGGPVPGREEALASEEALAREEVRAREEASAFSHPRVPPDATARYGDHPDQVIDFYRPAPGGRRPAPLVGLLHGGAWRAVYDRAHVSPLAAYLAAQGFAVASLEYRRGPADQDPYGAAGGHGPGNQHPEDQHAKDQGAGDRPVGDDRQAGACPGSGTDAGAGAGIDADSGADPGPGEGAGTGTRTRPGQRAGAGVGESTPPTAGRWPDTFDDVAAAVDALPRLAVAALGADTVDPRRVVLTGHSAGGHLALWAAARHVLPPDSPWHLSSPPPLRGVVALAPIADLGSAVRLHVCSDAVTDLLGGPGALADRCPHADPAVLVPTAIATTIVHGTTDNEVPPQVSADFARSAAAAGQEPVVAWLTGTGHFALIDPAAPAAAVVADEIAQLAW